MQFIAIKVGSTLLAASAFCFAQQSVGARGKWIRTTEVDKAGKTTVSFVLPADNMDPDRHPAISISCTGHSRPPDVIYNADVFLAPTRRDPMNYYSPALQTAVKVDDQKIYKPVWDVILSGTNQKRAIIDKKTLHNLLTGSTMRVRISDYNDESHLDEFTIGGLNVNELRDDCGSKWFGKEEASSSRNSGDEKKMK
jgi:hypothetical protein